MKIETLNKMSYEDVVSIEGICSCTNNDEMTLKEYIEGGWLDTSAGKSDIFYFKDGGYIFVTKVEDDEEPATEEFEAFIVDEDGNKERFDLMF